MLGRTSTPLLCILIPADTHCRGLSFRSKWLSGSAANIYMAASIPERQDQRGSTHISDRDTALSKTSSSMPKSELKSFDLRPGSTSDEKSRTSSTLTSRSRLLVEKSLEVIEISDEEIPSPSQSQSNSSWHYSSLPTTIGSSPVMGGASKKRGRQSMDIIVLSGSDSEDNLLAKKQRLH